MVNVLILGANGQLARNTTRVFLRDTDAKLTLYLRRASRLSNPDPARVTIVEGDVLDLDPYRDSAAVIEASDLDFTVLRPGWFTYDEEVAYQVTQKGEPFKGHDVSTTAGMEIRRSLGVSAGSSAE